MSLTTLILVALAQLAASPDPRSVPIVGLVVDGSGQPAPFADVWLAEALDPDEGRRFGMELWWSTTTRPDEGSTTVSYHLSTDASGRFTFRVPADAVARRSPRPLVVWAATSGEDSRLGWTQLPRIVLASDPPVRIVLRAPARTDLTILSPDRKPVAGARVTPVRAGDLPIRPRLTYALETTTDTEGRAVIACLAPEVLGAVRVEAPGFGTQTIQTPGPEFGNPVSGNPVSGTPKSRAGGVTVTLAPVGRIVGRLMAPAGEPSRSVTVRATPRQGIP